ncbi:uncharacterized protein LOC120201995 [Hibiscus syriacus]|uniref:uncharacterized protein LOC120201995 n=1 Tax=Hibiscus syriacus TaxID=106335 RepID=UPI0019249C2D|nr:uncharacterized protein LOC120201995 [Hibiscus syriacus]
MADQINELLMKNHELRPTGSAPFPEVNVTTKNEKEFKEINHANGSGNRRKRGRGYGRERGYGYGQDGQFRNSYSHQKWDCKDESKHEKEKENNVTNKYYRCGGKGHWSRLCRNQNHLVDLYQQSLKQKDNYLSYNL